DGGGSIGDAIIQCDGTADRLQRQERDRAERRVGNAGGGPAPRALGGEAERVIFQRLVGNPLIILAPDAVYPLPPCHFAAPDRKRPSHQGPSRRQQTPYQNLRRYFAVQYT